MNPAPSHARPCRITSIQVNSSCERVQPDPTKIKVIMDFSGSLDESVIDPHDRVSSPCDRVALMTE